MRAAVTCGVLFLVVSTSLSAQVVEREVVPQAIGQKHYPAAPKLALAADAVAIVSLPAAATAAADKLAAMRAWNEAGNRPVRAGIVRALSTETPVDLGATQAKGVTQQSGGILANDGQTITWSGRFTIASASRVRLQLRNVNVPAGTVFWVHDAAGNARPFGPELIDAEKSLWTPSVHGAEIYLEVSIPSTERASFTVSHVGEVIYKEAGPREAAGDVSCIRDATCFITDPDIAIDRDAIAHLEFMTSGGLSICTGGLMADTDQTSTIPYMLTANHCISTQSEAASLEAFWDYRTNACNGSIPALSSVPRTQGATLLSTSANTDVSLLKLSSTPADRSFLGWDANASALVTGAHLYRISHPAPDGVLYPQMYSESVLRSSNLCSDLSRPRYYSATNTVGATWGGSSGSPSMLDGGYVVGQLFSACGPNPADACDPQNVDHDGALAESYASIGSYLNPPASVPCVADESTACLAGNRFKVQVAWRDSGNRTGVGKIATSSADSALLWFFSPTNWEMMVKVLNTCSFSQRIWVFSAATTNVEYTLTVTDTKTGVVKTYFNPLGTAAPAVTDTGAFSTCP